jgi:hypothetical protein
MMARWEEKEKRERERERERERSILHVATPSVWGFTGKRTRAHAHGREREARERERVREKERERGAAAAFLLLSLAGKVLTAVGQNTSAEEKDHRESCWYWNDWLLNAAEAAGERETTATTLQSWGERKREREEDEGGVNSESRKRSQRRSPKGLARDCGKNIHWTKTESDEKGQERNASSSSSIVWCGRVGYVCRRRFVVIWVKCSIMSSSANKVKVAIRVRPFNKRGECC